MLFAGMSGQGASDGMYKDVSDTDWYYSTVKQLYGSGVLPHDEIFNGTEPALRGDIVKYMFNLYKLYRDSSEEDTNTVIFEDVGRDSEYFEAVNWAYANGITKGTSSGLFCPKEMCSKEQVCVMAVRFFDAFGIKPKAAGNTNQFADSLDISGFGKIERNCKRKRKRIFYALRLYYAFRGCVNFKYYDEYIKRRFSE